ncbi:uncharacterized protein B0H64DRAFT_49351 [Chaetomium fimeti]|uniref:Uncharacterized protein n=1 Tax=Chaetomium fimeti TaxID=1854472 RepID=A0AAE0H6T9_9PEZI|nr:hypothetical protein B0H64DRAFT_49351 [Chaetomium fimeti]
MVPWEVSGSATLDRVRVQFRLADGREAESGKRGLLSRGGRPEGHSAICNLEGSGDDGWTIEGSTNPCMTCRNCFVLITTRHCSSSPCASLNASGDASPLLRLCHQPASAAQLGEELSHGDDYLIRYLFLACLATLRWIVAAVGFACQCR